jgi:hypothetical protein
LTAQISAPYFLLLGQPVIAAQGQQDFFCGEQHILSPKTSDVTFGRAGDALVAHDYRCVARPF